jgi:serine phosphatase RsbU (regulator of sigma subunit)
MRLVGEHHGDRIDHPLVSGVAIVGRSGSSDLVLPSQTVSRRHAAIRVSEDEVTVHDLGSLNGTRVNGQDAPAPVPIHPGDVVEFGSVQLRFVEGEESQSRTESVEWSDEREFGSSVQLSPEDVSVLQSAAGGVAPGIFRLLTEAGQLLVLPESPEETFDRVLELVEKVIPSGRVIVLETDASGNPVQRAARVSGDRALSPLLLSRTMVGLVLDEKKSILTSDAQSDERFMHQQSIVAQDLRSAMAVPLLHHDQTLGVLYVDTSDPLAAYGESDLQALTLLGQMLGAKIANARLLEAARERERLEEELRTAASIQKRLLPQSLPEVAGYVVVGCQETCEAVGGDLYDAGLLPDGKLQVVLGDVSGKGIPAALLMSDTLAMIRALRPFGLDPGKLVERLHRHVLTRTEPERYLTLFLAEIDPVAHTLEYVNAGHPPARLVSSSGDVADLDSTGPWVGLIDLPGVEFERKTVPFPPGAALVITSDGIDEASRGEDEFYGDHRYAALLTEAAGTGAREVCRRILDDVESYRGDRAAGDDVTLVVVGREAETEAGESPTPSTAA